MADPLFFIDADLQTVAEELLIEFGVDGYLRRRTYVAAGGDARDRIEQAPLDIPIKVIDGGAIEALGVKSVTRNRQSVFFYGKGLPVTPDADLDSVVLKRTDGSFTDELKVTSYEPVFRGLENVILWEAVREG